jgi:hypothetical protein
MPLTFVPRASNLTRHAFWTRYVEHTAPVVLSDAAKDWVAVERWNRAYLEEHVGDVVVPLRSRPARLTFRYATVSNFLRSISTANADHTFVAEERLGDVLPALTDDIGVNRFGEAAADGLCVLMSARTVTPLHFHKMAHAISFQVTGTRRFLLLAPDQTSKLRPNHALRPYHYNFADRRIDREDLANSELVVHEAVLEPGEAIFIPIHWWHTVVAGDGLSILLIDFWSVPKTRWPKTEVAQRVRVNRRLWAPLRVATQVGLTTLHRTRLALRPMVSIC